MTSDPGREAPTAGERADHLKERIYVTFSALAVVIALRSDAHDLTAGSAATTLVITVLGTLLAVFAADFVSYLVVHATMPPRDELGHMLRVSLGAFSAILLPLVFVGLAALGVWTTDAALLASTVALLGALALVGYLAVRRVRMPLWGKLLVLLTELVLGVVVVALELLAHE